MSNIAERLLLLRGKVKQGEFAKTLEINPNTLRSYENGRTSPNQEFLEQICVQFSVSSEWLLLGRGPMRISDASLPPDCGPSPHPTSETPVAAKEGVYARGTTREAELETERRELTVVVCRLTSQNHELTTENRHLWKENGELREKCARFEERQYQHSISHDGGEAVG